MRIITGSARGMKLETPQNDSVRPTTEMAKEGIFSAIQFDIEGRRFLDLFAGSGQIGLEALSRGAEYAVFVDELQQNTDIIKKNAQRAGLSPSCKILRMDFTDYLKRSEDRFHYVFIDPPYGKDRMAEIVKKIMKAGILLEGGRMICESDKPELDLKLVGETYGLEVKKRYKYGKTYVHLVGGKEGANDEKSCDSGDL